MNFCTRLTLQGKLWHLCLQHILLQQLPQLRLPNLFWGQGFALALMVQHKLPFGPICEPICAVALIPIKHIRHLLRQLIALPTQRIVFDIGQQSFNLVCLGKLRQQPPKPPDQGLLVKWHGHWHHVLAKYQAVHAPNETGRQLRLRGSTNAHGTVVRQCHL